MGLKMAPIVYCAISVLPNNKTPEKWPTSEHDMSRPGNFLAIIMVSIVFLYFGAKINLKTHNMKYLPFPITNTPERLIIYMYLSMIELRRVRKKRFNLYFLNEDMNTWKYRYVTLLLSTELYLY